MWQFLIIDAVLLGILVLIILYIIYITSKKTCSSGGSDKNNGNSSSSVDSNGCVVGWSYVTSNGKYGPYNGCVTVGNDGTEGKDNPWCMLPVGIKGNINMMQTSDPNDAQCLSNWDYYDSDGKTLLQKGVQKTVKITADGASPALYTCPKPIYASGGTSGIGYKYC